MRAVIGSAYFALGKLPRATEQMQRALQLRTAALGPDAAEVAEVWDGMVEIDRENRAFGDAEKAAREAVRIRERLHPRPDSTVVTAWVDLARCLVLERKYPEADSILGRVERTLPALHGDTRMQRAAVLSVRADVAQGKDDLAAADSLGRESLRLQRDVGPKNPEAMIEQNNLATVRMQLGDLVGARKLLEESLETEAKLLGEDHPTYAMTLENLANVDFQEKKYDQTLERLQLVHDIRARNLGQDHIEVTRTLQNMAVVASRCGRAAQSLALFQQVLPRFRAELGEGDPETATCERNMSYTLRMLKRYRECDELLERSLAIFRKSFGDEHIQVARTRADIGISLVEQGRYQEALGPLRLALPRLRAEYGDSEKRTRDAAVALVKAYNGLGQPADAAKYRAVAGK